VRLLVICLSEPMMSISFMSAMVASTICILGSQCSSLKELRLQLGTVGLLGRDIAVLAALTGLELLEVCLFSNLLTDGCDLAGFVLSPSSASGD